MAIGLGIPWFLVKIYSMWENKLERSHDGWGGLVQRVEEANQGLRVLRRDSGNLFYY